MVEIPIIKNGEDISDYYETAVSPKITVLGTSVFEMRVEGTDGQYLQTPGSVTFTVENPDLLAGDTFENSVGFSVTRNGESFAVDPSNLVYEENTATLTFPYAGEYVITPYARKSSAVYTFDCEGSVFVAKAPSPITVTGVDPTPCMPGESVVFTFEKAPLSDADEKTVAVRSSFGASSGVSSYNSYETKLKADVPWQLGTIEKYYTATLEGKTTAGIDLDSLYEALYIDLEIVPIEITITADNQAADCTYADVAQGNAYVRYTMEGSTRADVVEVWAILEDNTRVNLDGDNPYGRVERDTDAGTITYYPCSVGAYKLDVCLRQGEQFYVLTGENPSQSVSVSQAPAPVKVAVSPKNSSYEEACTGEAVTISLTRQGVYDTIWPLRVTALDPQGVRRLLYEGGMNDSTLNLDLALPDDESAAGEWTIYVECTMLRDGKDITSCYEAVAPVSFTVYQTRSFGILVSDGNYLDITGSSSWVSPKASFYLPGELEETVRLDEMNLEMEVTCNGVSYALQEDEMSSGMYFVEFAPLRTAGEYEITLRASQGVYHLKGSAHLTVYQAPAPLVLTSDVSRYHPGDTVEISWGTPSLSSLDEGEVTRVWATSSDGQKMELSYSGGKATLVLPDDAAEGTWTIQAEMQIHRRTTQEDTTDCYEAVEPLQLEVVSAQTGLLHLKRASISDEVAPAVVRWQLSESLTAEQMQQIFEVGIADRRRRDASARRGDVRAHV